MSDDFKKQFFSKPKTSLQLIRLKVIMEYLVEFAVLTR